MRVIGAASLPELADRARNLFSVVAVSRGFRDALRAARCYRETSFTYSATAAIASDMDCSSPWNIPEKE
jgi:hypothetical protein